MCACMPLKIISRGVMSLTIPDSVKMPFYQAQLQQAHADKLRLMQAYLDIEERLKQTDMYIATMESNILKLLGATYIN